MMTIDLATDVELLGAFAREQSQDAFTALVRRHLDLVYSAALRQVRSPQLAEEVAQSVFTDLARHAGRLQPDTVLGAWLYQVTRRTASNVIRSEVRRQAREQIAVGMKAMNSPESTWTQVEPLLDEAMHRLDESDRTAVLLRYFEKMSLREVGNVLGISEDGAQKRVSRAVERLRQFFAKRGVLTGTSALMAMLGTSSVQAAPSGLAASISSAAALAGASAPPTTTFVALKALAMTHLQKTLICAGMAVLVAVPVFHFAGSQKVRYLPREGWNDAGQATPEAAFETYFWAGREGNLTRFMQTIRTPGVPPGSDRDAAAALKSSFEGIAGVRVQTFHYDSPDTGWFRAEWLMRGDAKKQTRSKWSRVGNAWKLVNDEPTPAVAQSH